MSQEELAAEIEIVAESLSSIERGASVPTIATFVALAEALDLDVPAVLKLPARAAKLSRERVRLEAELVAAIGILPDDAARELLAISSILSARSRKG